MIDSSQSSALMNHKEPKLPAHGLGPLKRTLHSPRSVLKGELKAISGCLHTPTGCLLRACLPVCPVLFAGAEMQGNTSMFQQELQQLRKSHDPILPSWQPSGNVTLLFVLVVMPPFMPCPVPFPCCAPPCVVDERGDNSMQAGIIHCCSQWTLDMRVPTFSTGVAQGKRPDSAAARGCSLLLGPLGS
eukprot:1142849-Pelagomonas_calceolata.AAC.9